MLHVFCHRGLTGEKFPKWCLCSECLPERLKGLNGTGFGLGAVTVMWLLTGGTSLLKREVIQLRRALRVFISQAPLSLRFQCNPDNYNQNDTDKN